ncbi:unnamed protein product, partial [Discosporangium mesarthrocarpum]
QAYYCCIAQLLSFWEPCPSPLPEADIYICGDSHTLTPVWNTVRVGGR